MKSTLNQFIKVKQTLFQKFVPNFVSKNYLGIYHKKITDGVYKDVKHNCL